MGKIKKGILNGFTGKIGNMVGYYRNGQYIIRTMAEHYSDPQSEGQLMQRAKFNVVSKFLRPMSGFMALGYKQLVGDGKTGYNLAVSELMKNAVTGAYPAYSIDYSKVVISKGSLGVPADASFSISATKGAVWTWRDSSGNDDGCNADDVAIPFVYDVDKEEVCYDKNAATRSDCQCTLSLPTSWSGDEIEVYLSMRSADSTKVCDSIYLGNYTAS